MEAGGPVVLAPGCAPSRSLTGLSPFSEGHKATARQQSSQAPTIPGLIPFAPPLLRTTLNPLMACSSLHLPPTP